MLTATDGFEALSIIADNHPDLIFVDIMMPRLDGYQTCALIKHNELYSSIPVIMLVQQGWSVRPCTGPYRRL